MLIQVNSQWHAVKNQGSYLRTGNAAAEGKPVRPFSPSPLTSFGPDGGKPSGSGVPLLPLGNRNVVEAPSRRLNGQAIPGIPSSGPSWPPPKAPGRPDRADVDEAELQHLGPPPFLHDVVLRCVLAPQRACLCSRAAMVWGIV